jgi:hypothetical protein
VAASAAAAIAASETAIGEAGRDAPQTRSTDLQQRVAGEIRRSWRLIRTAGAGVAVVASTMLRRRRALCNGACAALR